MTKRETPGAGRRLLLSLLALACLWLAPAEAAGQPAEASKAGAVEEARRLNARAAGL